MFNISQWIYTWIYECWCPLHTCHTAPLVLWMHVTCLSKENECVVIVIELVVVVASFPPCGCNGGRCSSIYVSVSLVDPLSLIRGRCGLWYAVPTASLLREHNGHMYSQGGQRHCHDVMPRLRKTQTLSTVSSAILLDKKKKRKDPAVFPSWTIPKCTISTYPVYFSVFPALRHAVQLVLSWMVC